MKDIECRREKKHPNCSASGFTLIEVMVVIAIMAILSVVAMPAYYNHLSRARQTRAISTLMALKAAQEIRMAETGAYATAFADLEGYATAGTVYQPDIYYQYRLDPLLAGANTVRFTARGDLNGDGLFCDGWLLTGDADKPAPDPSPGCDEGFSFSFLKNFF